MHANALNHMVNRLGFGATEAKDTDLDVEEKE